MMHGIRQVDLEDPHEGTLKLMWPTPKEGNPWGVLAPLKDTVWGQEIVEVTGEAFSHAMHGNAIHLLREIGIDPKYHAKKIPLKSGRCGLYEMCVGASANCRPGPKLPDCYEAPKLSDEQQSLASMVALAWREDRYVVVVVGDEFSLL